MSVDFWINVGVIAGIYGILTLGLQLNTGFTGLLNFGQAGFMAIGAYGAGILVAEAGFSLWLAFSASLVLSAVVAMVIGWSTSRLGPDQFAIVTIAFAEIVRHILQNTDFSGGNQGLIGFDVEWRSASEWITSLFSGIGLGEYKQIPLLLFVWITFAALTGLMKMLERTPWSRVLRGIRDDETAIAALGKNTLWFRMQSLAIGAALAAVAGFFIALDVTYLYPGIFDPTFTFFGFVILLIGGLGNYWGIMLGSVVFWTLMEGSRLIETSLSATEQASLRFLVVGFLLIVLSRVYPHGFLGSSRGRARDHDY